MSNLFDSVVIGTSGDVGKISSQHQHNLQIEGDTLKIATPRSPSPEAYQGEICWNYQSGSAKLFVCVVGASLDEDGEILKPAVWYGINLTPLNLMTSNTAS